MDRLLMRVDIVPHDEQRYQTTGDWQYLDRAKQDEWLHVSVSDMGNDDYAFLVGIHELIEAWLCRKAGVEEHNVTEFDMRYENSRDVKFGRKKHTSDLATLPFEWWGEITETSEPGDDGHAPYYAQHQIATRIEKQLVEELGVDWNAYEQANLALYEKDPE